MSGSAEQVLPEPGSTLPVAPVDRRRFLARGSAALLGVGVGVSAFSGSPAAGSTPVTSAVGPDRASTRSTASTPSGPANAATAGTGPARRDAKAAIADLRKRLHGRVLLPGDAHYAASSAARNGRYANLKPAVIAQCADEADVVTAVKWGRDNGLPPVVRGGGHSYAGFSNSTGLEIDLSRLKRVNINPRTGTAVLGGAALNKDAFDRASGGRWILPAGTCGLVAIGGLTLGGGIGYHTHWAGLTSDHLVSTRVVTADGTIVVADERSHPDLFWACRGGSGGSFGVNTSFTYHLAKIPLAHSVYFRLDWRGADAAAAMLSAVDTILQTAPAELNISSAATATPIGRGGAREAVDVLTRGHFLGSVKDLTDLLKPLMSIPGRTNMVIEKQRFWDAAKIFVSNEATPHSWGDISRYTAKPVPSAVYAKLADMVAACPIRTPESNGAIWSLGWVGGPVVDRFAPADTAYVHRGMKTLLRPTPVWRNEDPPAVGNELMGWTLDMTAIIDPHSPGDSYQNFPNRFLDGWENAYYGNNWERLRDVKTAYDPTNLFQNPQSIPPRFS